MNGNESDDSDNDNENYNRNDEKQEFSFGFAHDCYKIVPPILLKDVMNDFLVCRHCSGTFILVQK